MNNISSRYSLISLTVLKLSQLREMVEEDGHKLFTLKREIEAGNERQRERDKKYEEQKREYEEQNLQHLRQLKLVPQYQV